MSWSNDVNGNVQKAKNMVARQKAWNARMQKRLNERRGRYSAMKKDDNAQAMRNNNAQANQEKGGRKHVIHTGPKGGKYVMRNGEKVYV